MATDPVTEHFLRALRAIHVGSSPESAAAQAAADNLPALLRKLRKLADDALNEGRTVRREAWLTHARQQLADTEEELRLIALKDGAKAWEARYGNPFPRAPSYTATLKKQAERLRHEIATAEAAQSNPAV